jgi:2-polyprenyl-6-methoxyphenol hydroxylase-like FAD-dependent oxidoreductase
MLLMQPVLIVSRLVRILGQRLIFSLDGSGAGFAIEDSAVLSELLSDPAEKWPAGLRAVFQAFGQCRRARTQWLVASS